MVDARSGPSFVLDGFCARANVYKLSILDSNKRQAKSAAMHAPLGRTYVSQSF